MQQQHEYVYAKQVFAQNWLIWTTDISLAEVKSEIVINICDLLSL